MQTPFCSIIVLNYQGEKIITATLESLVQLDYPKDKYEIIVVDNGSQDKSKEVIENFCHPELVSGSRNKFGMTNQQIQHNNTIKPVNTPPLITSIYLSSNLGFAGGNNKGIKIAKGKYVVLLNNDCIVDKNWLKELVAVAEKDNKIFAVNSKLMLANTNKIQNAGIRIFPNGYARDVGAIVTHNKQDYEEDKGQYEKVVEIDAACAAAVLYRKSILDKIGFLDESFFLYYEDVEISERAKKHGYKILYAPKAIAYHKHAITSEEWSPFFIYHSEKGRLLHMIYHFPIKIFFTELLKFSYKSILRIGFAIKHPARFSQQMQYIKVSLFFFFLWPFYLKKDKSFNIAYEISPLLAKTGEQGEKSGLYRLLFNTIQKHQINIIKNNLSDTIYLYVQYPHILDDLNRDLDILLKAKNTKLIYITPYCMPYPLRAFRNIMRFIYRIIADYNQKNYLACLKKRFKKENISVIHHSETCFFEAPDFINRITINDLIPIKFPQFCKKNTIEDAKKRLAFAHKYADEVICISENTKKDLLQYWSKSHPGQLIKVIYPSVSLLTRNSISSIHKSLIPNRYFLTYGTYEPRKNLMMLVKAFIELDKKNKLNNHSLVLAGGKGWENVYEDIEKFIKTNYHDIKQSPVIQLGFVKDEVLSSLIKNAKAVLYPTLYEGYGFPVVESLQIGTPVFCSNNSSLPEVCKGRCTLVKENEWEKAIVNI